MLTKEIKEKYDELFFGKKPMNVFCPYRICPLGAHSDHQFGKVTGIAINKGITILFHPTESGECRICSLNFDDMVFFNINDIPQTKVGDWADYLRGVALILNNKYKLEKGINAVIEGTLPIGGLSSSAAVCIAFMGALCKANGIRPFKEEFIDIPFKAETSYVEVNVGKLDQSCEVYCRQNKLLYLDTKDGSYELIPRNPHMRPYEIAIFFSGVERTLVGSKFNMRVDELKAASYALKGYAQLPYGKFVESRLRDVPREVVEEYKDKLPENWRKRATHFYTEFDRVEKGAEAWRNGNLEEFGKLIFESGYSSIHNYETGSEELIALYDIMLDVKGIYGGRFSGAGFKGCCMALINPTYRESIKASVTEKYLQKFPHLKGKYSVHFCRSVDGLKLED